MTDEELKAANSLAKEIKELDLFIWQAEKAWSGKIIKRKSSFIFRSDGYGALTSAEYQMDTEMKNRVLDVLRDRLTELKEQLHIL
ncbi:hypothetical protein D3C81_205610 [compost metagenome]